MPCQLGRAYEQNLKASSMRFPMTLIKLTPNYQKSHEISAALDLVATGLQLAGEVTRARATWWQWAHLNAVCLHPQGRVNPDPSE